MGSSLGKIAALSPLVSLVLLFGQHGKAVTVPSVVLNNTGNRYVAPADNPQPHPSEPADTDGSGTGTGPHPIKPPVAN
jgi:hypothetical protein